MPLIIRKDIFCGELAVWRIDESEPQLAAQCSREEQEYARSLSNARRRCEWLAWHVLLHELLPNVTTAYDSVGAPILVGEKKQIAVSHTSEYAALLLSDQPCGIDIELPTRDFSHAASRFLSDNERKLIDANDSGLQQKTAGTIWCAKECLYKWAKIPGLNFVNDMTIDQIDFTRNLIAGSLLGHPVSPSILPDDRLNIVFYAATYPISGFHI